MEQLLREKLEYFYLLVHYYFKIIWKLAEHHIRNANELVNYIDNNINNTDAFNIIIPNGDLQTIEVETIKNLRKYFCYVWNGEELGKYSRRSLYCYCSNCQNNWEKACKNTQIAGKWKV